jgi:uncharacterized membrane protein YozB (DUF420 family)
MSPADLPAVNAALNATSAAFLIAGYWFIRKNKPAAHRNCMLAAFAASTLFLVCYITYHVYVAYVLKRGPTIFRDPAWFRPYYLFILGTHTILAMAVVPMALGALWFALKEKWTSHKRLARWTWPIWIYVSVTGVLIYYLLYIRFPQH